MIVRRPSGYGVRVWDRARILWRRMPGCYCIVHRDVRRRVLTVERADISRYWTPYGVITCSTVDWFSPGVVVEIVR